MATGNGSCPPAPGGGRVTVNVGALTQAIASAILEATRFDPSASMPSSPDEGELALGDPCSSNRDKAYKNYVDLIDLTGNTSTTSSDDDSLPVFSFSSKADSASTSKTFTDTDVICVKHALQQHQLRVMIGDDEEDVQRICVRRNSIVADTFRQFSKTTTDVSKRLKVVFIGESSIDEGGPRREYLQLALKEIFVKSGLFVGWPQNVIPVSNTNALMENKFYIVGRLISTCLVQGGVGPMCFSKAAAEFLVFNEIRCKPSVSDIHDCTVRDKLLQVERTLTDEDLRKIVSEMDFRFECGYKKSTNAITLADKSTLIKTVWIHHIYKKIHAELSQLQKGLRETLMMDSFAATYPEELLLCLVSSSLFDVTPAFFLDAVIIKYSVPGSNNRMAEESVVLHWNDYVLTCADNKDGDGPKVSLPSILQFITGSSRVPAAGFSDILSIVFTDDECLPVASTCDLSLTFSRSYGFLTYVQFEDRMNLSILNSFGFGAL